MTHDEVNNMRSRLNAADRALGEAIRTADSPQINYLCTVLLELLPILKKLVAEPEACDHGVTFDEKAAEGLTAAEVQRRWPRGWFTPSKPCAKCGFIGIAYASYAHFISGDW